MACAGRGCSTESGEGLRPRPLAPPSAPEDAQWGNPDPEAHLPHPTPSPLTRFLAAFSSFIQACRFLSAKLISPWLMLNSDTSDSKAPCRGGAGRGKVGPQGQGQRVAGGPGRAQPPPERPALTSPSTQSLHVHEGVQCAGAVSGQGCSSGRNGDTAPAVAGGH